MYMAIQMAVIDRIMKVDFMGPVALTKAILPYMVQQRSGHIVVTSSTQGMETKEGWLVVQYWCERA